jgi:Protein of unknown function (DUF1573)
MKRIIKSVILILFIMLPAAAYAEPSIIFASEMHDFGSVKQGAQLEYAFEFANAGTDELVIKRITPS